MESKTLKWIWDNPVPDADKKTLYEAVATIAEFGERKFSQSGKGATKVKLQDSSGEFWAKIWDGNAGPIDGSLYGKPVGFHLKGQKYQGKAYLSGFWEIDSATLNKPPQAPVNPPQSTPTAQTPASPPQSQGPTAYEVEKAADRAEKRRSVALSYALEYLKLPLSVQFENAESAALHIAEFVETGNIPIPYDGPKEERQAGEDPPD